MCVVESGIIVVCKSFYPIFNSVLAVFPSNCGPNVSCSIDFQFGGSCSFSSNCGPNVSCSIDFQFGSCSFSSNCGPNVSCSIDFQFSSCSFSSNCGPDAFGIEVWVAGCLAAWLLGERIPSYFGLIWCSIICFPRQIL